MNFENNVGSNFADALFKQNIYIYIYSFSQNVPVDFFVENTIAKRFFNGEKVMSVVNCFVLVMRSFRLIFSQGFDLRH